MENFNMLGIWSNFDELSDWMSNRNLSHLHLTKIQVQMKHDTEHKNVAALFDLRTEILSVWNGHCMSHTIWLLSKTLQNTETNRRQRERKKASGFNLVECAVLCSSLLFCAVLSARRDEITACAFSPYIRVEKWNWQITNNVRTKMCGQKCAILFHVRCCTMFTRWNFFMWHTNFENGKEKNCSELAAIEFLYVPFSYGISLCGCVDVWMCALFCLWDFVKWIK